MPQVDDSLTEEEQRAYYAQALAQHLEQCARTNLAEVLVEDLRALGQSTQDIAGGECAASCLDFKTIVSMFARLEAALPSGCDISPSSSAAALR